MDIIICVAKKDFRIVKKTINNVRSYIQAQNDKIYIIGPQNIRKCYRDKWLSANNCTFIDENKLVLGLSFDVVKELQMKHFKCPFHTGWYLQQFLKMGFALSKYAQEKYLIWDSDTIPLKKIEFVDLGKDLIAPKQENNRPYFDTMEKLFGFGKLTSFSFIAEHMVIETAIMREMIDKISSSSVVGNSWFSKILNATSGIDETAFSEFETYGNYCMKYHPDIFKVRYLRTLREAGMLFGRGVKEKELKVLSNMGFDTASFEYYHNPPFPRSLLNKLERLISRYL